MESSKKRFDANKVNILKREGYPYIVRMSSNNGRRGFIKENPQYLNEENTLSFGQDTSTVFYQEVPYFTGDKIKILKCKEGRFGKANAQFFVIAIMKAFKKFSWGGSSYSVDIIENQVIKLPIKNHQIDFDFMEDFINDFKTEHTKKIFEYLENKDLLDCNLSETEQQFLSNDKVAMSVLKDRLDKSEWKEYRIGDLFRKVKTNKLDYKAKDLPERPQGEFDLPCLTSSFRNQGLNYYVPRNNATILKNVISIPSNSDVYRAYYQPNEFTVLSDAYAVEWKDDNIKLTPEQYLFFVVCINKVNDLHIYSYKTKLGGWKVVKDKKILLPTKNGSIDFLFIDTFLRILIKYLLKNVVDYIK